MEGKTERKINLSTISDYKPMLCIRVCGTKGVSDKEGGNRLRRRFIQLGVNISCINHLSMLFENVSLLNRIRKFIL